MNQKQEGALSGYRVLDLTDSRGAYCAKLLADLGADVIKIEPPEGDPGRRVPPFAGDLPHHERSLHFLHRNANKRGVTLNLRVDNDMARLMQLVRTADVLVAGFEPDPLSTPKLDYPTLREVNPGLIMASMTEFGPDGPYKNYKGSNLVHFAMSGTMITSGFPGKTPCLLPGSLAYDSASLIAAIGILAALLVRRISKRGQYIETSVHEASRICLYPWILPTYTHLLNEAADGGIPPEIETRRGDSVYPVYPCKDGFVRLLALTPRQWDSMVRVLGSPEVLLLPDWRNFVYRIFNADALYPLMAEYTEKYTMRELFEAGHREGVPIAPVYTVEDFVNSPHTKSRGFFAEVTHPTVGAVLHTGPPYKWSASPASVNRSAPQLGEHNEEILPEPCARETGACCQEPAGMEWTEGAGRPPLEGIRVIGFETGAAGPDFTKVLGELGADVIKIEAADNLDFMRCVGSDINRIGGFNESNRNKRSLGLNLKTDLGREIARKLVAMSDIVADNFRGGVMESLGLDYQSLRKLKPDIIYIRSQGFGSGGPYGDYQAYGPTIAAASGMLSLWAHPDDPYPAGSNAPLPDHIASKHLAIAALAALDYRHRTGNGQCVDVAQTEVAASLLGEYYMDYTVNGRITEPMGNRSTFAAPHGCYRCRDEDTWCAITVFTEAEWRAFCEVVDPSLVHDHRFATLQDRLANVDDLDRLVEDWTATREPHEIMDTLQAKGVPAGVVQRAPDTMQDPQLAWLGAIIELDHPRGGKTLYPAIPFRLSGTSPLESRPAPLLGQHTEEICRELLGMSNADIDRWVSEDILYTPSSVEGRVTGIFG